MTRSAVGAALALLTLAASTHAQSPGKWKIHDMNRPRPDTVVAEPALLLPPPSDAIVLFDGDDLAHWESPRGGEAKWVVRDGYMESVKGSGGIRTKQSFGDVQLHVEFALPTPVEGEGQGRGNSGVFLMGLYEIQVLDSWENYTYADGQAGALYGQSPPLVNAARRPGEWQTYDIVFRRPRFTPDHQLIEPARLTVFHNGVVVQDAVEAMGPTRWLQYRDYGGHPDRAPLSLQDHSNPVRFRNIWVRELAESTPRAPEETPAREVTQLSQEQIDGYAGVYEPAEGSNVGFELRKVDGEIKLWSSGRPLDLVTHSTTEFTARWADAKLVFTLNPDGSPDTMVFHVGRHQFPTKKRR